MGRGWEVRGTKGEEEARYGEEGGRAWVGEVSDLHILSCLLDVNLRLKMVESSKPETRFRWKPKLCVNQSLVLHVHWNPIMVTALHHSVI